MTFGSLFAGIGGMDLGLERAGMTCKWQVEINPYCRRVLEKHWPKVQRHGDITELTGDELERVDLIAGGFPCQDVSGAGRREGIAGKKSGLWSEYIRLVRHLRPRYVLVENVSDLLVRGMGRVLGDLAESGYDAVWDCIPAASVGAPHVRDRVFILAHSRCESRRIQRQASPDGRYFLVEQRTHGEPSEWSKDRKLIALVPGVHPSTSADWWRAQSRVDRSADGVPDRMERLKACGNAVVPQVAQWIGERILAAEAQCQ